MKLEIIGKYLNFRKNARKKDLISLRACKILLGAEMLFILVPNLSFLKKDDWMIKLFIIFIWLLIALHQWLQFKRELPRSSSNLIMTKLLSNAISPNRLGIIYLFLFVVHLGWITNSSYDLVKTASADWLHPFLSFVVAIMGTFILILFFPDAVARKKKNPKKIFVSGMSNLYIRKEGDYPDITQLTLYPLISALKYARNDESCEFLIFQSTEQILPDIETMNDYLKSKCNLEESVCENKEDYLKYFIRSVVHKLYSSIKVDITIISGCNYDNCNGLFSIISEKIKEKDNEDNKLYFNITPGPSTVGSILTLFSLDSSRVLCYYPQKYDSEKKAYVVMEITEIDKSKLPLENLLSEAMENIKS